jgi:hypothetical protein
VALGNNLSLQEKREQLELRKLEAEVEKQEEDARAKRLANEERELALRERRELLEARNSEVLTK